MRNGLNRDGRRNQNKERGNLAGDGAGRIGHDHIIGTSLSGLRAGDDVGAAGGASDRIAVQPPLIAEKAGANSSHTEADR